MFFIKILVIVCVVQFIRSDDIAIGGIFDGPEDHEKAFKYAIDKVNRERNNPDGPNLVAVTETAPTGVPFVSFNLTCSLLSSGIFGIFGPKSVLNIDAVQSVCDEKEIPHIIYRANHNPLRSGTIINLYPQPEVLSKAYFDIIYAWNWKSFTILYENNEGLMRLSWLIKTAKGKGLVVIVRQLDQFQTGNYRPILKDSKKSGQHYFLIDCEIENLHEVLIQAQQVGLVTQEYHFLLTNLDSHTEELISFQYSDSNITGIRLVNPDTEIVQKVSGELYSDGDGANVMFTGPIMAYKLRTETALIVDAVEMYAKALLEVIDTRPLPENGMQCTSSDSWDLGLSVVNLMRTSYHQGLTGLISFNNEGYRSEFQLDIFELKEGGMANVGTWNSSLENSINISRVIVPGEEPNDGSLQNRTFIITTTLTDPYGMLKDTQEPLTGNDRFEGFGIDLIHELAMMEGFNYTFIIREDKSNGARAPDGTWSGMIGDVMDGRADLAISDLTITLERADAVEFTTPFMNLGISILFQKPGKAPPNFFSFAEPFAKETWMMLALAFVVVSLSLYIMGRLCADEWTNPYPCIEEPEYLINQFSLSNSIWFATGSLMCQGSEIAPIAISTRMVAGMWWFFCLIMTASYTANLAAFLATENPSELFKDVTSLVANAKQHGIRYGSKKGGATANFFRDSQNPTYITIAEHMKNHPEDMPSSNDLGVSLAEETLYAFFMESTTIEYVTQRHCDLQMYGQRLDEKGYGIAMRKGAPYRHKLNTAILKLKSAGVIEDLKRKWWEERRGGGQCTGEAETQEATPLDLVNVEGVFYVTLFGSIFSMILVLIEFILFVYKVSKKRNMSFREVFRIEMKHYLNFESNVKEVTGREENEEEGEKSESKSNSGESGEAKTNGKQPQYGFILSQSMQELADKD